MSSTAPLVGTKPADRRRTIVAASAGNFAEWYDWGVYGVVATILASQFFPEGQEDFALVSVYAVFAISYLSRPFGTIVFGHIADSIGRKKALSMTIVVTCSATAAIGLIPTYGAIGYLAPVLLLALRLVQSLGTGGEYSTAISFVYEHGRMGRKATAVGVLTAMTFVGFLVGSLLATGLSAVMGDHAFETWGWRVLFLLALPMGATGLYLRRRTEEGAEFQRLQEQQALQAQQAGRRAPFFEAVATQWRRILLFIGFLGTWATISATLTSYLATFLKRNDALSSTQAYSANTLASAMVVALVLLFSPVADRIGLYRSSIVGSLVVAVLVVPGFMLAGGGVAGAFAGAALLGGIKGVMAVPSLLAVSQIFPAGIRVTAGGLSYNIAQSLLGGTAPLVAVTLNNAFDNDLWFSSYLVLAAVVTLVITLARGRQWIADSASHSGDVATTPDHGAVATDATVAPSGGASRAPG